MRLLKLEGLSGNITLIASCEALYSITSRPSEVHTCFLLFLPLIYVVCLFLFTLLPT